MLVSLLVFPALTCTKAEAATNPTIVATTVYTPAESWVHRPGNVTFTDRTYQIQWGAGPTADNVSLFYVLGGKEYSIARVKGSTSVYYWSVPDTPDPSRPAQAVFHSVRIKAVWQDRITKGGKVAYQNLSTALSEPFAVGAPGAVVIRTQELPVGTTLVNYDFNLTAVGGTEPYYWELVPGYTLPSGLHLSNNGQISGKPSTETARPARFRVSETGLDPLHDEADLFFQVVRPGEATDVATPFNFSLGELAGTTTVSRPATGFVTQSKTAVVRRASGTPETVQLRATGIPDGVQCAFTPWTGSPPYNTRMNFTVSHSVTPGTYPITIRGTTESGLVRTVTHTLVITTNGTRGDLALDESYRLFPPMRDQTVSPIQVVDETTFLIKGKNTLFRAVVSSTFDTDLDVEVQLWLPTTDWDWEGVPVGSSMDVHTASRGTYRFPEHYIYTRTVTVPAHGEVEVWLPDPAGLTTTTLHSSAHNRLDQLTVVDNAPRPGRISTDALAAPEYAVIVDPGNRISESSEGNNCPWDGSEKMKTYPTGSLNMFFSPVISDDYVIEDFWPGGVTGDAFEADFRDNITTLVRDGAEFMLGVYPVADDKFSYYLSEGVISFHERGGDSNSINLQQDMADMAAENGYDRFVGLVPIGFAGSGFSNQGGDWLGVVYGSNPRASFVCIDPGLYMVIVHENYHNLGYPDIYGEDYDILASEGYWVNGQKALEITSGTTLHDYMDYVYMSDPYWTTGTRIHRVMTRLPDIDDPAVLLFRCGLYANGTTVLSPFMIVDGKPDAPAEAWNYRIVLKDAGGAEIRDQKVNVSFTVSYATSEGGTSGTMPYDRAFISSMVPWSNDVALIELRDLAGNVVASRAVSRNVPSVHISEPVAGSTWRHGNTYAIKWSGSDPDGDALNYSLALSPDQTTWTPVAIDIVDEAYAFDTRAVVPGQYYFRVRATDGVLSSNDTMMQAVTISVAGDGGAPATATVTPVPGNASSAGSNETVSQGYCLPGVPVRSMPSSAGGAIGSVIALLGAILLLSRVSKK